MLRQRLRREIASLTAEGRISAVVLGLLPPGLAGVLLVVNPGYLSSLTGGSEGRTMLFGAFAAMLVGFIWMHRIVSVEI
jgi:tight adherence protein B